MTISAILKTAYNLIKQSKTLTKNAFRKIIEKSPKNYFVPKNADIDRQTKHYSPSSKYVLSVTPFKTKGGSWDYTQGLVYDGDSQLIATINRNYSCFIFKFVENHPNGHDYLICGENYQGQTVVELDTGKRRNYLPDSAADGFGFCWSSYKFDNTLQILVVCGCYWACPYEFRFFDFSDPMAGWPELELDECVDEDMRWPTIEADGTVKTYQSASTYDDDEDDDEEDDDKVALKKPPVAINTFKRDGLKLTLTDQWVSDEEKERRQKRKEDYEKYEKELAHYKVTDAIYLRYRELVKDPALSPDTHESTGVTYGELWCPHFTIQERRMCRRIVTKHSKYTIDLEWGAITGPIKLVIFKDHKKLEDKFFEHSVAAMEAAFEYTKNLLRG